MKNVIKVVAFIAILIVALSLQAQETTAELQAQHQKENRLLRDNESLQLSRFKNERDKVYKDVVMQEASMKDRHEKELGRVKLRYGKESPRVKQLEQTQFKEQGNLIAKNTALRKEATLKYNTKAAPITTRFDAQRAQVANRQKQELSIMRERDKIVNSEKKRLADEKKGRKAERNALSAKLNTEQGKIQKRQEGAMTSLLNRQSKQREEIKTNVKNKADKKRNTLLRKNGKSPEAIARANDKSNVGKLLHDGKTQRKTNKLLGKKANVDKLQTNSLYKKQVTEKNKFYASKNTQKKELKSKQKTIKSKSKADAAARINAANANAKAKMALVKNGKKNKKN